MKKVFNMELNWHDIENKWKKRWQKSHIYESDPNPGKPKFFLTVAYPYPNSPQHIGHGRTYTIADVYSRYKRMCGYNVLFPMAFHYTGTPIIAMSKRLKDGDKDLIETFVNIYKIPKDYIKNFYNPVNIAKYFHNEIKLGMDAMGYGIDWRREFTTVDSQYSKFITWQFDTLHKKGLISQGSHPVGWCPTDGNPVGQHDTLGDKEPEIGEYFLIKFSFDGCKIPTATLRPETLFGVTNIWIKPDVIYLKIKLNDEIWIVSEECVHKLKHLNYDVLKIGEIKGSEIVGKYVINPITNKSAPILPADFVDPENGTGIVMSVPAHAPFDLQALEDLKNNLDSIKLYDIPVDIIKQIEIITVIESPGYSQIPAQDLLLKMNITNQNDPKLETISAKLYAHEFHSGIMKNNCGKYSETKADSAREMIKNDLTNNGDGLVLYEIMNKPLLCRCGTKCVVKIFEEQWFLNYNLEKWKKIARLCSKNINFIPGEIKNEFDYVVEWLRQKACARKAGLGTTLPWDSDWIIEALSDSVIYMAYYLISKYVNLYNLTSDQLINPVFDYIFYGVGNISSLSKKSRIQSNILVNLRDEFLYFYPLDSRHSGRDLVPNHLSFFIFNHCAIFSEDYWPKQIVVNGSVLMNGKKMSKTYGNIIPLKSAVTKYGADPLRLTILGAAELLADADISLNLVNTFSERIERFYKNVVNLGNLKLNSDKTDLTNEDIWILNKLQNHVSTITKSLDMLRVREAINEIIYIMDQDVSWYLKRKSKNNLSTNYNVLREFYETRIKLLAPFAPFICEELWEILGNKNYIALSDWPKLNDKKLNIKIDIEENLIKKIVEDCLNIIKVTKIKPSKVIFYTCAKWKLFAYFQSLKLWKKNEIKIKDIITLLMSNYDLKDMKAVSNYLKQLSIQYNTFSDQYIQSTLKIGEINEFKILGAASNFISNEINATVTIYSEDDDKKYDPKLKSNHAKPFKPAIYIE